MRIAVYPGTFDPVTNGHLDLVERGRQHVDVLILAILRNEGKEPMFSVEERTELLHHAVAGWSNVRVDAFDGLLVDYARAVGATLIPDNLPRNFPADGTWTAYRVAYPVSSATPPAGQTGPGAGFAETNE